MPLRHESHRSRCGSRFKPGEEKMWNVIGMDLDGLTTPQILLHYDPTALDVSRAE